MTHHHDTGSGSDLRTSLLADLSIKFFVLGSSGLGLVVCPWLWWEFWPSMRFFHFAYEPINVATAGLLVATTICAWFVYIVLPYSVVLAMFLGLWKFRDTQRRLMIAGASYALLSGLVLIIAYCLLASYFDCANNLPSGGVPKK